MSAASHTQCTEYLTRPIDPIYNGETYRLKFMFTQSYPIEAPEVVFVRDESHPVPMHPHVYSNGIICLDLLDRAGWSPVHNVESVCVSLQSMLTSNTKNERPPGDDTFVRHNTQRPRDINFVFHDEKASRVPQAPKWRTDKGQV